MKALKAVQAEMNKGKALSANPSKPSPAVAAAAKKSAPASRCVRVPEDIIFHCFHIYLPPPAPNPPARPPAAPSACFPSCGGEGKSGAPLL